MKKFLMTACRTFLIVLGLASTANFYATDCIHNVCNEDDDTFSCQAPLYCGYPNFQIHAGFAPILWFQRGSYTEVSCNASGGCTGPSQSLPTGPVIDLFTLPRYHQLFKMPWTVGAKLGYGLTDKVEIYAEANYRHGRHKDSFLEITNIQTPTNLVNIQFTFKPLSSYTVVDCYLGARYYFDPCWCDRLSWFVGTQVGMVHHNKINYAFAITSSVNGTTGCSTSFDSLTLQPSFTLFHRNTSVAGGLNIGADLALCDCISLVLTGEIIATAGPRGSNETGISFASFTTCTSGSIIPLLAPNNFIVRSIGTEMLFPITLGLKYSF